jgi:putative endonuclease
MTTVEYSCITKAGGRGVASKTRREGDIGEDIATKYLVAIGWRIVERNVLFRVGELDIVAEDESHLVFVEVRSRYRRTGPSPANTVTLPKQRRLTRAANLMLQRYAGPCPYARFDVIAVDLRRRRVDEHFRGAFDAAEF